jgi:hypothetical protein
MADPQFIADTAKADLPVTPVSGADATKIIAGIVSSEPSVVAAARKVVQ